MMGISLSDFLLLGKPLSAHDRNQPMLTIPQQNPKANSPNYTIY
jgi:hypothetical protein